MRTLALLLLLVASRAVAAPLVPPGWTDCSPGTKCFRELPPRHAEMVRIGRPLLYAIDDSGQQLTVRRVRVKGRTLTDELLRQFVDVAKFAREVESRLIPAVGRPIGRIVIDETGNGATFWRVTYATARAWAMRKN